MPMLSIWPSVKKIRIIPHDNLGSDRLAGPEALDIDCRQPNPFIARLIYESPNCAC